MGKRRRKIRIAESLAELEQYRGTLAGDILYAAKKYETNKDFTVANIAMQARCKPYQARYVLDQYEKHGLAALTRGRGRKVDAKRKSTIIALVRKLARLRDGKPTVKPAEVRRLLDEEHGIKLTERGVAYYCRLAEINWRVRVPRPRI